MNASHAATRIATLALCACFAPGCELLLGGENSAADASEPGVDAGSSADAAIPPDAAAVPPDAATEPPDAAAIPPDASTPAPDAGCEATFTCPIPTSGLLLYYRFDGDTTEASGGPTLSNSQVTFYGDRFGAPNKAASFLSSSTYSGSYLYSSVGSLPTGNSPRSISVWAYPYANTSSWAYRSIVGYGSNNAGQRFGISTHWDSSNNTDTPLFTGQQQDVWGNRDVYNGWHHLAVAFDGSSMRFYVDGVQSGSGNPSLNTVGTELNVGRSPGSQYSEHYAGLMDDLRIYNRALSDSEIAALFHEKGWH